MKSFAQDRTASMCTARLQTGEASVLTIRLHIFLHLLIPRKEKDIAIPKAELLLKEQPQRRPDAVVC